MVFLREINGPSQVEATDSSPALSLKKRKWTCHPLGCCSPAVVDGASVPKDLPPPLLWKEDSIFSIIGTKLTGHPTLYANCTSLSHWQSGTLTGFGIAMWAQSTLGNWTTEISSLLLSCCFLYATRKSCMSQKETLQPEDFSLTQVSHSEKIHIIEL